MEGQTGEVTRVCPCLTPQTHTESRTDRTGTGGVVRAEGLGESEGLACPWVDRGPLAKMGNAKISEFMGQNQEIFQS